MHHRAGILAQGMWLKPKVNRGIKYEVSEIFRSVFANSNFSGPRGVANGVLRRPSEVYRASPAKFTQIVAHWAEKCSNCCSAPKNDRANSSQGTIARGRFCLLYSNRLEALGALNAGKHNFVARLEGPVTVASNVFEMHEKFGSSALNEPVTSKIAEPLDRFRP